MTRGGVIGIRFEKDTRIKDANPNTRHAAMNSAENSNQFENDSLTLSYRRMYGKIRAKLMRNP